MGTFLRFSLFHRPATKIPESYFPNSGRGLVPTKLVHKSCSLHDIDPLSFTASVIAIIGLAAEVIKRCKDYVSALEDAPTDLCSILIEVGSVKCVLETLEMRSNLSPSFLSVGADGPVEGCHRELKALRNLIPATLPSKRKRSQLNTATCAKLAWPFKEDKARKILENLGRHKLTIILILTTVAG